MRGDKRSGHEEAGRYLSQVERRGNEVTIIFNAQRSHSKMVLNKIDAETKQIETWISLLVILKNEQLKL